MSKIEDARAVVTETLAEVGGRELPELESRSAPFGDLGEDPKIR